jgi:regulator of replication initiation timing
MAQVRQAQAQLIRLQMQAAGGATYDAEHQVVLDNDVFNALVEELDDLKDELLDASHEAAAIEARVRLEASNELAERLARLDDTFRVRLHSEVEAVEEKYRSKLAIAQRYQEHMHVRDNEKAGELHKAFEFVKGENEKLEQQISALRVKLSEREALLAKTAEQTGMALGAVQAERTRLESEMAANAERFDSVVASRQMENENLRAQLADDDQASAKHDAARAEAESRRLATQVKHLMEERDALQSECNDWRKQMSGASAKSRQAAQDQGGGRAGAAAQATPPQPPGARQVARTRRWLTPDAAAAAPMTSTKSTCSRTARCCGRAPST